MNRFKEILDDLARRAEAEKMPQPEGRPEAEDAVEPALRLPYSSDPKPIEEPWK
jgi:hypothetical protein